MLEWGFDRVIGHRCGFVDVSTQFLTPALLAGIPANRGVAVVHDADVSDAAIEPCVKQRPPACGSR